LVAGYRVVGAVVLSRSLPGLDAPLVTVECHAGNGLPGFNLVGLPETEVTEARDRVRAALQNANFDFPPRKFTVNLAPADLPKESGRFDLPIALGVLAATGQLPEGPLETHEFAGELALVRDAIVHPARSLLEVCAHIAGRTPLAPLSAALPASTDVGPASPDLADVRGQDHAKRALTIAAAGAHSLLIL